MSENKIISVEQIQNFKGKYPKQIWSLFMVEMWERFSFYGMRGILTIFMVSQLMMDEKTANLQYGANQAFVYAFTFVGGLLADKILGYRRSLFWGGLLMIAGSSILAIDPKQFFYLGSSTIIIGSGFFKPNISTLVGKLYKDGDHRRDAGFSLFYSGINLGALIGGYLVVAVAKKELWTEYIPAHLSWNAAFGLSAVAMVLGLIIFYFTNKQLGSLADIPEASKQNSNLRNQALIYLASIAVIPLIMIMVSKTEYTDLFMYTIGPLTLFYIFYEMRAFTLAENKKIIAAIFFILVSIIFWAFFEQSGGSLSLFAYSNLNTQILGMTFDPNGINNASNSLFIIAFAPLIGLLWIFLHNKKMEPNALVKFSLSFIFLAGAFYLFYATRFFTNEYGVSSLEIFTLAYLVISIGELCLSPIGLSIMTKLSPQRLQGLMMGTWFLASAYGQYVAGLLGAGMVNPDPNSSNLQKLMSYTEGYKQLAIYALITAVIVLICAPFIKKLMQEVK